MKTKPYRVTAVPSGGAGGIWKECRFRWTANFWFRHMTYPGYTTTLYQNEMPIRREVKP